eukprot:TRINITY_DN10624_c0_g1_i6.p1 TRINITY_DN10624_c0_g1~~TRINITY_DN10624_c0_g1_i6.p1  ORF type:complete len:364 (+),score=74.96 TRINITY_DN10624_c0_g1_i6:65-1156(+)
MPIQVKDYTWSQTESEVRIDVPLKGINSKKADVYTTDCYVKINFPPFFFEVDLFETIDHQSSTASIGNGLARFTLIKSAASQWEQLQAAGSKQERLARRLESQSRAQQQAKDLEEALSKEKHEAERAAVRRQMDLEEEARQEIEQAKQKQRNEADRQAALLSQQENKPSSMANGQAQLPAVRTGGKIKISFSKREFATPQRESHKEQEDAWLAKQAAARKEVERAKSSQPGDVEHDPLWYRDRGRNFFNKGDFQSAINAFTAGLTLDPANPGLYSHRAATHLKLGDAQACAADSTKALSLLTPPCPANAKERMKAHVRRAVALEAVEDFEAAIFDYKKALDILPNEPGLMKDLQRVENCLAQK